MKITEALREEHIVIKRVLTALEAFASRVLASGQLEEKPAEQLLDFLGNFSDRLHHAKEEEVLFPLLEERGLPPSVGPIVSLLEEHRQGRALMLEMRTALAEYQLARVHRAQARRARAAERFHTSAMTFVQLLRAHISKEDNVLFPLAERLLDARPPAAYEADEDPEKHREYERYLRLAERICEHAHVEAAPRPS